MIRMFQRLVSHGELEPIVGHLESLSWLRKHSRPASSKAKAARAAVAAQLGEAFDPLQAGKEAALEKKKRQLLIDCLTKWLNEDDASVYASAPLLMRLSKDENLLEQALRKLFRMTMDEFHEPPPFLAKTLLWFCKQTPVRRKANLLIFACGILRNWTEHERVHVMILEIGYVPYLFQLIAAICDLTVTDDKRSKLDEAEINAETPLYARLLSQVVVGLRNLIKSSQSDYTPETISNLSMFLVKQNKLHTDDHVILMVLKLLG